MKDLLEELQRLSRELNEEIIRIVDDPIYVDDDAYAGGMREVQERIVDLITRYQE